jgi:hypothetical protein
VANRDSGDKSKVKFVYFEVEGSTPIIQESLRSIAASLKDAPGPGPRALQSGITSGRTLTTKPSPATQPANGQMVFPNLAQAEPAPATEEDAVVVESSAPEADTSKRTSTSNRSQKRLYPQAKIDNNIEIAGGNFPLTDFIAQKNPSNHAERYLVLASWLKDQCQRPVVSIDQIYTCYKLLDWSTPDDIGGVFRKLKRQGCFSSPEDGSFSLTNVGENHVNKMGTKK